MDTSRYDQLVRDPGLPVSNPTQSYWQSPPYELLNDNTSVDDQPSSTPSSADVVIIGSGITACSVARELLTDPTFHDSITILEAREICSGATGRNGGRINCVAVLDYDEYRRKFDDGGKTAEQIVRFKLSHLDDLLEVATEMGPEFLKASEVRTVDTVAAVFGERRMHEVKRMLEQFDRELPDLAGRWRIADSEETAMKYHIQNASGALIGRGGAAWPYRFVTKTYAYLLQRYAPRFSIRTNTAVLNVVRGEEDQGYGYRIETSSGDVVKAKHIVYCTEAHAGHLLPQLRGILVPRRGQMTVQNPGQAFPDYQGERSWSFYFERGYDYLCQNAHTGEIFIGGGDLGGTDGALDVFGIASDENESVVGKSHLVGILPVAFGQENWGEQYPGRPLLKTSWSGVLCNTLDAAPLVGMVPPEALGTTRPASSTRGAEWISAGYGGDGMVNAWKCGRAVARQVLGEPAPLWLPEAYKITSERMQRLSKTLAEIGGTSKHLQMLM